MSDSRERGIKYISKVIRLSGKGASVERMGDVMYSIGNKEHLKSDSRVPQETIGSPEMGMLKKTDTYYADKLYSVSGDDLKFIEKNDQNLFFYLHFLGHFVTDSYHAPGQELKVVGGELGLFKASFAHVAMQYYDNLLFAKEGRNLQANGAYTKIQEFSKREGTESDNFLANNICNYLMPQWKPMPEKGWVKKDVILDVPLKDKVGKNELAIKTIHFIESMVRGDLARTRMLRDSPYGEQLITHYAHEIKKLPMEKFGIGNEDRMIAAGIVCGKIPRTKLFSIHEVFHAVDLAERARDVIGFMLKNNWFR